MILFSKINPPKTSLKLYQNHYQCSVWTILSHPTRDHKSSPGEENFTASRSYTLRTWSAPIQAAQVTQLFLKSPLSPPPSNKSTPAFYSIKGSSTELFSTHTDITHIHTLHETCDQSISVGILHYFKILIIRSYIQL